MKTLIIIIEYAVFIFLAIQIVYLFFFSVAGTMCKMSKIKTAAYLRRIRIIIPAYKEDAVIIETARFATSHDYPKSLFEVVIMADSLSYNTLLELKKLPITVYDVNFIKSTKGKALQKAIELTQKNATDIVVVLDADNHMSAGFLHKVNNAFDAGYKIIQGHRTAKKIRSSFARLEACTEEINNHIFRRGHNAVGLPSALIGSGMAFEWSLFVNLLKDIGETTGEDKEIEFRAVRQGYPILFFDNAYIYDEKVSKASVFTNQRSRWLATQGEFFSKYFHEGLQQLGKGNIAFFNKVFQAFLLPRIMLLGVTGFIWILAFFTTKLLFIGLSLLLSLLITALLIAIPLRWYNRKLISALLQIPIAYFSMFKAYMQMKSAKTEFIHTPHGETA